MNLLEIAAPRFTVTQYASLCCPAKGYRGEQVYAVVRVSQITRYIFTDGRTLTVGPKTRYATFPSPYKLMAILLDTCEELAKDYPRTKNCWIEINTSAIEPLTLVTA